MTVSYRLENGVVYRDHPDGASVALAAGDFGVVFETELDTIVFHGALAEAENFAKDIVANFERGEMEANANAVQVFRISPVDNDAQIALEKLNKALTVLALHGIFVEFAKAHPERLTIVKTDPTPTPAPVAAAPAKKTIAEKQPAAKTETTPAMQPQPSAPPATLVKKRDLGMFIAAPRMR